MPAESNAIASLLSFLSYFIESLGLLCLFITIFIWTTPHRELSLIRSGNVAAALGLSGAIIGFVLPLASVIAHSSTRTDVAIWGLVALLVQICVFQALRCFLRALPAEIANGNVAEAILAASLSVGVGVLNAACMIP